MLPPNSAWIDAPKFPMTLRERTTMPRTTPTLRTTLWPARSLVVATSMASPFRKSNILWVNRGGWKVQAYLTPRPPAPDALDDDAGRAGKMPAHMRRERAGIFAIAVGDAGRDHDAQRLAL